MKSAESVKQRLKNLAKNKNQLFQDVLTMYGLERTMYRVFNSDYSNHFVLKGGILLYVLFDGNYPRITSDSDLEAFSITNDLEQLKTIFSYIFSRKCDDPLYYDLESLELRKITEFKEYHGVHLSIMCYLDKTRIPIAIDIGFGDVLYPGKKEMNYPNLLGENETRVLTYPIETVVAEKVEAIISLGIFNSRYKDFYDLYVLSSSYNFNGETLQKAMMKTFSNRHTELKDFVEVKEMLLEDATHQLRWKAFTRSKKTLLLISFTEALEMIEKFINPVIIAILSKQILTKTWDHSTSQWK